MVTAVDQSAQMVELAQRRGVGARVMRETGEAPLHAHYDDVRLVDLPATVEMITASTAVFVASRVR